MIYEIFKKNNRKKSPEDLQLFTIKSSWTPFSDATPNIYPGLGPARDVLGCGFNRMTTTKSEKIKKV